MKLQTLTFIEITLCPARHNSDYGQVMTKGASVV